MDINNLRIGDEIIGQINGRVSKVTRKAIFYTSPSGKKGRAGRRDCKVGLLYIIVKEGQKERLV